MNGQIISVLYSVLLATTFLHEIRAKAAAGLLPSIVKRSVVDPPLTCETCKNSGNTTLSITANAVGNIFAVINETENVALVLDVAANITGVISGTGIIVIDLKNNTGVSIRFTTEINSTASLLSYIASLASGLSSLLSASNGTSFQSDSAPPDVQQLVNKVLGALLENIEPLLETDAAVGLQITIALSLQIIGSLAGVLGGLLQIIGSSVLTISLDLAGLLNFLAGLGTILQPAGGLNALSELGVQLNISHIISSANGLILLNTIIVELGSSIADIQGLLDILNNPEALCNLISQLGGGSNVGIDGIFKVLARLISFLNGNTSLEILIGVLIQFLVFTSQSGLAESLSKDLNQTLSTLLETIEGAGLSEVLSGLVKFVQGLINGNLEINGLDISAILNLLLLGVTGALLLNVLVQVLVALNPVVDIALALGTLLFVLILYGTSILGLPLLSVLGLVITIPLSGIIGSIIGGIVGLVPSLLGLLTGGLGLLTGGLFGVLVGLPVIGGIIALLDAALTAVTNGQFSCQGLLNGSSPLSSLILGLLQLLSGISLGVSPDVVTQVQNKLNTCTSPSFYLGVNIEI